MNGAEALLSDLDKEAEGKVVEEAKQKTKVLTFCFFLSQSLSQPPRWSSRTLVLSCRLCPTASTSSGRRLEEDLPSPTDRFQQVAVICLAWKRRKWQINCILEFHGSTCNIVRDECAFSLRSRCQSGVELALGLPGSSLDLNPNKLS